MEILFKSNDRIFFIEDDKLDWNYIDVIGDTFDDVPHIKDQPILYHIICDFSKYPVYYEYNDIAIIFEDRIHYYALIPKNHNYIIDYTEVNINNIINENII